MTFEKIVEANKKMQLTPIKGKDYAEVNQRVKAFRYLWPDGSITTDIVSLENGVVVIKATVCDGNGKVLATGTSYEREGSSPINKTSYIENCETSAVGRALGLVGLGIDTGICSADELNSALAQQEEKKPAKKQAETKKPSPVVYEPKKEGLEVICADCGKPLTAIKKKDGSTMSIVDMAAFSKTKFGKHLCGDCMKKEAK